MIVYLKENKAEAAILIANNGDFKTKSIKKTQRKTYTIIKKAIQEEHIFVNMYTPKIGYLNM